MNNKYPSFAGGLVPEPDYDCRELRASNFLLKCRCNKNNPNCQKFIEDEKQINYNIKVIELDANQHGNDMVDIWVCEKNPFGKISQL